MGLNCPTCNGHIKVIIKPDGQLETIEACAPLFGLICMQCGAVLIIEDKTTMRSIKAEEWNILDPDGKDELMQMQREARYSHGYFLYEN